MKDVHEFLDGLGLVPPGGRIEATATYHDACHLAHAQGIAAAPRRLLAKIPGLQLRNLPESGLCCGSAGTYNLNEPAMSDRLAARKMQNILATGRGSCWPPTPAASCRFIARSAAGVIRCWSCTPWTCWT